MLKFLGLRVKQGVVSKMLGKWLELRPAVARQAGPSLRATRLGPPAADPTHYQAMQCLERAASWGRYEARETRVGRRSAKLAGSARARRRFSEAAAGRTAQSGGRADAPLPSERQAHSTVASVQPSMSSTAVSGRKSNWFMRRLMPLVFSSRRIEITTLATAAHRRGSAPLRRRLASSRRQWH